MASERVERRLAAILAADIVGYSRLMGLDEAGSRARVVRLQEEAVFPSIEAHRGRLFKTMGDGYLAEFASVVDAVDCAVDLQRQAEARAAADRAEGLEPLRLRIGVNLGDVIVEGDDIHGDGVNVSARLEALAEPGGIRISRSARDQIRDKLAYAIADKGEVEVKNIARPVRVFAVASGPAEAGASSAGAAAPNEDRRPRRLVLAAAAAALLAVAAGALVWLEPWTPRVAAASVEDMALPLPDKPSVAVLPFALQSTGEGDAAFAEALGQDLTSGLARIPSIFVIARSSARRFEGADATPDEVAEALGVAHVVRGVVRRNGDRVRLDVEMIDALSGRIIWSERFDRASEDLFALQDALVEAIATRLSYDLRNIAEQPRFTTSPEAYLLWAQADHDSWINTPESYAEAEALARQSLAIDPDFLRPQGVLTFVKTQRGWFRMVPDREAVLQEALAEARALVEAGPDDWFIRTVHAQTLLNAGDYAAAAEAYERVLEAEPGSTRILTRAALPHIFLGTEANALRAEAHLRLAMRLNPYHGWLSDQLLGQALYILERYEEAAEQLALARQANPNFIGNKWWRVAVHGQLGRREDAAEAVDELKARVPGVAISTRFIRLKDPAADARFVDGLRKAGLPD